MIVSVTKMYGLGYPDDTTVESYEVVYDNGEKLFVPIDEGNRHYQEVLQWVSDGNEISEPS